MATIYCPRCDSRHDAAGAPWCAQPRDVPRGIPEVYGTLGAPAVQPPGGSTDGPAPGDLELFAENGPGAVVPYDPRHEDAEDAEDARGAGRTVSVGGAELVVQEAPGPRARHRRYKRRNRRLAGAAAAGMTVLSGGLLAASALGGGGGGGKAESAAARAETPELPLPSDEPDGDTGSATPDGDRPSGPAAPDGEERTEARTPVTKPVSDDDRGQGGRSPATDQPVPSTTTPAEGNVSAPDPSAPGSSSPSTATPTPTPSGGGGNGSGDSGGSGGGSEDDSDRDDGGLDLPLLPDPL